MCGLVEMELRHVVKDQKKIKTLIKFQFSCLQNLRKNSQFY